MKKLNSKRNSRKKTLLVGVILLFIALVIGAAAFVHNIYNQALKPVSKSQNIVLVEIPSGYSTQAISKTLKEKGVIKESWAFEWYVRNSPLREDLKAGSYALRPSQTVPEIVTILAKGIVATDLVTILPGQRIDQVEATLINSGFKPKDVVEALRPENYKNHPALVDKPVKASLEGYLYPESFQKTAQTSAKDIVIASLDEMQKRLTPAVREGVTRQGLTVHEGIILASIIEQEVAKDTDRAVVAQIFLKRLRAGGPLQSDVTVLYGAIADGKTPSLTHDSRYNTFKHTGLPVGPISNVTDRSLDAVRKPAKTDHLYFVAGDNGKTYFADTLEQHQANVDKYCKILCN